MDNLLNPGKILQERYRVVRKLGNGGMSQVYLVEDLRLGGKWQALKLTRSLPGEEGTYHSEARLLSQLQHPHLPQIVDYVPPDETGLTTIVMSYIEGETLTERFERLGRRLSFHQALRYLMQLAEVLAYLHAQQPMVVFRDLKPANVMIDSQDRAILVDFGIARRYKPGVAADTLQLGTPAFAAPEQLRGAQTDARTDIYGLGALAYYLMTGGAYAGRVDRMARTAWQSDVPPLFREGIVRMLADCPADRPPDAAALLREWNPYLAQHQAITADAARSQRSQSSSHLDVSVIALVSAYPGTGATFASMLLSERMNAAEVPHALVECPGGEAEMYAWLDGARRMPHGAVYADPNGMLPAYPAWRHKQAAYYPLHPHQPLNGPPEDAFGGWLRKLGAPFIVLDVSSNWATDAAVHWLSKQVDYLYLVADCLPVKWNDRRQQACAELLRQARREGVRTGWIANRDHPFQGRQDWLSLFPEKPVLRLPQLPPEAAVRSLWHGDALPLKRTESERIDEFWQSSWLGEK